ncbi:MAG: M60 family metallopeptidase [Culturomica sp.]|jgi:hypothetical protein|nr:M60 family metallopeptidase [Culturomica sp.]
MKRVIFMPALFVCLCACGRPAMQTTASRTTVPATAQFDASSTLEVPEDTKIPVYKGKASSSQLPEGIQRSFDGDQNTIYHSSWRNQGEAYFPIDLEYFFKEAGRVDYMIYYPRQEGVNGNIRKFELYANSAENPEYRKIGTYDFGGAGSPGIVPFDPPLRNPEAIKLHIFSGAGDGQGFVSCAEMEFYRKNNNTEALTWIFTDGSYSELKKGTDLPEIEKIGNDFLKQLALQLWHGTYDQAFRIQEYRPYPYPHQDVTLKANPFNLLDNPTGIYAEAGEDLVVFVGNTHGSSLSIRVIDYPTRRFGGTTYLLKEGVNKLKMKHPGLVYVMYHSEQATQPVKIHFATGKVNGYFDKNRHSDQDWVNLLNGTVAPFFDAVGDYAHLCFPVENYLAGCPKEGNRLIQVYDSLVLLEEQFIGLQKYKREQKNRIFFVADDSDLYMYATAYRTGYSKGPLNRILNPELFRTTQVWGPAHEVGHVLQTRPGLRWQGMVEVTNNILSLYVQTTFGNPSRILQEREYPKSHPMFIHRYPFSTFGDGARVNVFVQLIPFWQLQLYNSNVLGRTDFYADVFERIRKDKDPATAGEAQLNFVKLCCEISGYDLTGFFADWGFLTPVAVTGNATVFQGPFEVPAEDIDKLKKHIASLKLKKPLEIKYLRDNNAELFKNNREIVQGTAQLTGNSLQLNGWKHVVAYEVRQSSGTKKQPVLTQIYMPQERIIVKDLDDDTRIYAVSASGKRIEVRWE